MTEADGISRNRTVDEISWLAAIVQTSSDSIFSITKYGAITSWNPASESYFGYPACEVIGQSFELLFPQNKNAEALEILSRLLKRERICTLETTWQKKDGFAISVSVTASPIFDDFEEVIGASFISRRIPPFEQFDVQPDSESMQRTLLDNLIPGVIIVDPKTHLIEKVNPATAALFGAPAEMIEGRLCHQFLCPAQLGACPITDLGQVVDNSDRQLICADGARIPILKSVKRIRVGNQEKLLESFVNISERKRAEEALRESEAKFRALVEQNSEGVVLIDEKGIVIEWNPAKAYITGIPAEEAIGSTYWDLQIRMTLPERRTPERCEAYKSRILQALETGQSSLFTHPIDAVIQRPDGQIAYLEQTIFPVKTSLGYRIGSVTQDISARTRAMQSVRENEELFRTSFENATAGISLVGLDGKFNRLNGKLAEILGYSREELQQLTFNQITHPEDRHIGEKLVSQVVSGEFDNASFEKRYIHKTGKIVWAFVSTGIVRGDTGQPLYFVTYTQDITEQKRSQQEIQQRLIEMEVLHEVAVAGTEATSQEELCQRAIAAGQKLYPSDFEIGLIDDAAGMLRFPVYHKLNGQPAPDMALGYGVTGQVAQTGIPIRLDDVSTDPGYIETDPNTKSEICLPILVGNKAIGVINIESDCISAFGQGDERILTAMAGELGTALEKIRLFEKTERQLDHLTALRNIDQSILSNLDLNDTLEVVLDKTTHLLQVDAADIILFDPLLSQIRVAASCGLPEKLSYQAVIHLDDPLTKQIFFEGKPQFIPDLKLVQEHIPAVYWETIQCFSSAVFTPLIAKGEIQGSLQLYQRSHQQPGDDWMSFLQALAGQTAIAIDNAQLFADQQQTNMRLVQAYEDTLDGWSRAMDLRDHETEGHSKRVADLTLKLARRLAVPEEKIAHLHRGAKLHDIGKMGIPDNILLRPGKLTESEWVTMRQHPVYALDFLSPIKYLQPAIDIPYCHHEKWDGSGYPRGLQGEAIPLFARIFALVDVYDALTSDRPYRPAWAKKNALDYIKEQSGKHFDPGLVEEFITMITSGES